MKKLIVVFLMVLAFGCAKKQVTAPQESMESKEAVSPQVEEPEVLEEAVMDVVAPKEEVGSRDISLAAKEEEVYAFNDALFDFDKYNIRNDARAVLDSIAAYLIKNGGTNVVIEGHCDERGTNDYNLALGERRANAARSYLAARGVAFERMSAITYGEEKPVCTDQNETCWQKNRRAHFVEAK